MVDKERRMSSSTVDLVVIREGRERKPFCPVILSIIAEDAKVLL